MQIYFADMQRDYQQPVRGHCSQPGWPRTMRFLAHTRGSLINKVWLLSFPHHNMHQRPPSRLVVAPETRIIITLHCLTPEWCSEVETGEETQWMWDEWSSRVIVFNLIQVVCDWWLCIQSTCMWGQWVTNKSSALDGIGDARIIICNLAKWEETATYDAAYCKVVLLWFPDYHSLLSTCNKNIIPSQ